MSTREGVSITEQNHQTLQAEIKILGLLTNLCNAFNGNSVTTALFTLSPVRVKQEGNGPIE